MNAYEGLSLSELMNLLHDIVPPAPVALWPATAGWWLLGAWLLALALIALGQWLALRRKNRYRREALSALDALAANNVSSSEAVAVLLKRTALGAYPRHQVAALQGDAWAEFLRHSSQNDPLVSASAAALARAAYRPPEHDPQLVAAARRWIQVHRA